MKQAATNEKSELRLVVAVILLSAAVVSFGILLQLSTAGRSTIAQLQQTTRAAHLPPTMNFVSGSERHRAEACKGNYACDEEGGWSSPEIGR